MQSAWLCVDPGFGKLPEDRTRIAHAPSAVPHAPVLGIFTDDPARIARTLPRPLTPFVPAPEDNDQWTDSSVAVGFGLDGAQCSTVHYGISVF
jgi:hypothetical protein